MRLRGKLLVDAVVAFTFKVTRRDIEAAHQANDLSCAMALALRRRQGMVNVSVGASVVYVEPVGGDRIIRYVLSKEDQRRLHDFDAAGYFGPGTFTLLPPPPHMALGARAGKGESGSRVKEGKVVNVRNRPPLRHVRAPREIPL